MPSVPRMTVWSWALTDYKDKAAFLNMTARKTFGPEIAMMGRTQAVSAKMGI